MKYLSDKILLGLLAVFIFVVLIVSIRGFLGNPTAKTLSTPYWKENGPLELSPERGRFALTYSLVENHSFVFSNDIGKFAEPDVAVSRGRYVSLFAPLVSFMAAPGYIIGRYFGASQFGAFSIIAIFALFNTILLIQIGIILGANKWASAIASTVFIFGTPAFAYAVNLYQHHISTFLILASIYALLKFKKVWGVMIAFLFCAAAIPLDYPNLFFMFPIGVYALGRIISFEQLRNKISIKISLTRFLTLLVMILPIIFFLWFNNASYGNPFQLSGTLQSVKDIQGTKNLESAEAAKTLAANAKKKTVFALFQTRNMVNGFYIHTVSPDRGVIYYAPVILFGIVGFLLALKKKVQMVPLLGAIVGANVLLYSMWGDPWGGWAFGSRYLIPSYAILSIFVALLLTYWNKKVWVLVVFIFIAFYSIAVNTLGAITTSAMPPQVEVLELEKVSHMVQKYTYAKNWDFLLLGHSKSFAYQTFFKSYITPLYFYEILVVSIFAVVGGMLIYYIYISEKEGEQNV